MLKPDFLKNAFLQTMHSPVERLDGMLLLIAADFNAVPEKRSKYQWSPLISTPAEYQKACSSLCEEYAYNFVNINNKLRQSLWIARGENITRFIFFLSLHQVFVCCHTVSLSTVCPSSPSPVCCFIPARNTNKVIRRTRMTWRSDDMSWFHCAPVLRYT